MPELSKTTQIALALAMPTSVLIAYWLYSRWSSDEEYYGKQKVVTSHNTKIKILVPSKAVGTVIGKQGTTIKRIAAETGARLNFNDRSEERDGKPRELMITGTFEMAQKAEMLVYQVIADMPELITEKIEVPHYCVGRIIGKGGATIRDLRRASGARIDVDKDQGSTGPNETKTIALTGSRKEIDLVMELIDEIVKQTDVERPEKRYSNGGSTHLAESYVLRKTTTSVKATAIPVEEDDHWDPFLDEADMTSGATAVVVGTRGVGVNGSDAPLTEEFFQVMVSAVEHPGHFWVQTVGSKSLHLEQMQTEMTHQLDTESVRESLAVTDPQPGDMVAAKFEPDDPVFYRAKVLGMTEMGEVDLYFVDYGDNTFAAMDSLYKLRPEFIPFPHQAIECCLAGVEPWNGGGDSEWTDEGITSFEDRVHCAQWKPLYAKTLTYTRVQGQTGQGEGDCEETLRPCLQLIDTLGDKDVDIAEELVRLGHAKRVASTTHHDHSDDMS